jgi:uncharacterized damage-inducible protein DinB
METADTALPISHAVLGGWKEYQDQLVVVVRALTADQLALRVAPHLRSAGEIAAHIAVGRSSWFSQILGEKQGDAELEVINAWDQESPGLHTGAELAEGLVVTWSLMENAISRWTHAELTESIILPWIGPAYPITRSWVVWHVLEHDLHHGGELTLTLGILDPNVPLPPLPPES